jgi:hypothetical protein
MGILRNVFIDKMRLPSRLGSLKSKSGILHLGTLESPKIFEDPAQAFVAKLAIARLSRK